MQTRELRCARNNSSEWEGTLEGGGRTESGQPACYYSLCGLACLAQTVFTGQSCFEFRLSPTRKVCLRSREPKSLLRHDNFQNHRDLARSVRPGTDRAWGIVSQPSSTRHSNISGSVSGPSATTVNEAAFSFSPPGAAAAAGSRTSALPCSLTTDPQAKGSTGMGVSRAAPPCVGKCPHGDAEGLRLAASGETEL